MNRKDIPGLFGQKHSSRDYTKESYWGKNQFNSSFPASLVAYMHSKNINPVYLCMGENAGICHQYITGEQLYGINPLSDDIFYNFEAGYSVYEKYYIGNREKTDLVTVNRLTNQSLRGLEIKLTALPDNTTKRQSEDKYSCEIVMRPPTICFLACSMCEAYTGDVNRLRDLLSGVPQIVHWEDAESVAPCYGKIQNAVLRVAMDMREKQQPLIIQPVWKTEEGKMRLADDCLDVFVWSNLATILMCVQDENVEGKDINRFQRTIIWIYRMLFDYVTYGVFDYVTIIKNHSYGNANDKAFSLPGTRSYKFLKSLELLHPRIKKNEIKNIILGGGQNLLSPERRFDAVIVNSTDLFD